MFKLSLYDRSGNLLFIKKLKQAHQSKKPSTNEKRHHHFRTKSKWQKLD